MAEWQLIKDRIASLCNEWNKAERYIKQAEQIEEKVPLASINELRYAGRRLIEAFAEIDRSAGGEAPPEEQERSYRHMEALLQDAEFNCHRARHDAVDAAVSKIALDLDEAAYRIGYTAILNVFRDMSEFVSLLSEVQSRIAASREDRSQRDTIYAAIEEAPFQRILELYKQFRANENLMKAQARNERWKRVAGYGIGVIGIIIGLIGILL